MVDAQATYETGFSLWAAIMSHSHLINHAAGWLEGGLSASLEKIVVDAEMLRGWAEILKPVDFSDDDLGLDAIRTCRRAAISSARRTPSRATSPRSTARCCRTGRTSRTGATPARAPPPSAPRHLEEGARRVRAAAARSGGPRGHFRATWRGARARLHAPAEASAAPGAWIANARMYAVTPPVEAAWRELLAAVARDAQVPLTYLPYPAPQPLEVLWSRPDLGAAFMCGYPIALGLAP